MASVHRRKTSKYWWASWRQGNIQKFRSTKQTERSKSIETAQAFERASKSAMAGTLTEVQARRVLADILEKTGSGETMRSPSVRTWLKEWIALKSPKWAPSTVVRYQGVVDQFVQHLEGRADKPLYSLTSRDLQGFVNSRKEAGCAPGTARLDGVTIRAALNTAHKHGLISNNPGSVLELPTGDSVERAAFTQEEVKMLVNQANGEWKSLILLGYYTGARLSDCCKMKWTGEREKFEVKEGVDFTASTVTYWSNKTQKLVAVPLHPELQDHLEKLASTDSPEQFILPGMANLRSGGRHGLSEAFKRIARAAGVDLQTVQGGGVRKISRRTFHALRHTFNSNLANAGVSQELRMKLTGHKTARVNTAYTHHEAKVLQRAVSKLKSLQPKIKECKAKA